MSQPEDFPFQIEDIVQMLNLNIRRRMTNGVYVDCPFCGDNRGKMNVDYIKNVWRCNYCGECGGMLSLYAKLKGINNSIAYRQICDAISNGYDISIRLIEKEKKDFKKVPQALLADNRIIHNTFSKLLTMLTLSEKHRNHLKEKRGLSDEQIKYLGYKSTPPFYNGRLLVDHLIANGCTVEGVPGFYKRDGKWTINFTSNTSGILLPVRGIDGLIHGFQIRLDMPIKNKNDVSDKEGTKYIWLSSSGKYMGTSSGSPVHFVGNPFSRTVYVTEGILKSDIAHCLMNRTFIAIPGANNTAKLDLLFAILAQNGTQLIIEAHDMDKYRNEQIEKGASKIFLISKKYGMECRRLIWNPNYKGIDDWQLALRQKQNMKKGENTNINVQQSSNQVKQCYRIYQLALDTGTVDFAFGGIKMLHKAGYEQPPADLYQLVYDGVLSCDNGDEKNKRLKQIFEKYQDELPDEYLGRSISPSDILELYDEEKREYYYVDKSGFYPVKFLPMLAKALNQSRK